MNTEGIIKCALAIVGTTQIFKNIFPTPKVKGWVWTILTIIVGVGITALYATCPPIVMDGIIGISGATIFYDTIYKTFEKLFKHTNEAGEEK